MKEMLEYVELFLGAKYVDSLFDDRLIMDFENELFVVSINPDKSDIANAMAIVNQINRRG